MDLDKPRAQPEKPPIDAATGGDKAEIYGDGLLDDEKRAYAPGSGGSEEGSVRHMLEQPTYSPEQTKRLLWRCDKYLLPFLALLYLLSFLDRTNIGNARLADLEEGWFQSSCWPSAVADLTMYLDLGMSGWDYNIAVSVFVSLFFLCSVHIPASNFGSFPSTSQPKFPATSS